MNTARAVARSATRRVLLSLIAALPTLLRAADAPPAAPASDAATLARIRAAALESGWAYERLADLADTIGPRLAGSRGLELAIERVSGALRGLGARVTLQPVKVPHWERGVETGEITGYPEQPTGLVQSLRLTALGGSAATAPQGLTAEVLVVRDLDDLAAHAAQARGRIVVFTAKFDQRLADDGMAGDAYGSAGVTRFAGPAAAAALGAVGALVRSIGGADYRLPHTGSTSWKEGQTPIPAAALAAEDADRIARLAGRGTVTVKITLGCRTLPDADSYNVIADWPGREQPDQVVIVSGHLDSWDLGTGAIDDGLGVMSAAGVIEVMQRLNLHPRRTIRFIAWSNEENGTRGSKAYFASVKDALATQSAAIESDFGVGRAQGVRAALRPESYALLQPVSDALQPIGAGVIHGAGLERGLGTDIGPLQAAGVPGFAPIIDGRHYFDYHHTAADTLDKIDPQDMRTVVATLAVLAYHLAELPEPLPRLPAGD